MSAALFEKYILEEVLVLKQLEKNLAYYCKQKRVEEVLVLKQLEKIGSR